MSIESLVLGIDVGGTGTKMGLVDTTGHLTAFRKIPTNAHGDDPAPFLTRFYKQIDQIIASTDHKIAGIGVSMHGELDNDHQGPIICSNTPALRGIFMRDLLEERYQLPVIINNDLTAHTLGEYYFGSGHGVQRFMCMAIGTGLGAGVIINGKPLIIDGGNSGNTGLIVIAPTGPVDANGIKGSAEALCGVPGIERLARERYGHKVPAHEVIASARKGDDQIAVEIMGQIGAYLGHTLASLSVIFYPHKIVLTGGTTTAGPVLLDACRERFDELVGGFFSKISQGPKSHYQTVEIVLGGQGSETGILGAVVELLGLFTSQENQ
jgi:glucokinase